MSNKYVVVSSTGWQPSSSSKSTSASAKVASGQQDVMQYDDSQVADQYLPPLHRGRRPGTVSAPTSGTMSFSDPAKPTPPSRSANSSPSPFRGRSQVEPHQKQQQQQQQQTTGTMVLPPLSFSELCAKMPLMERFPIHIHTQPSRKLTLNDFKDGQPRALQLYIIIEGQPCAFKVNYENLRCSRHKFPSYAYEMYANYIFNKPTNCAIGWFAFHHIRTYWVTQNLKKPYHRITIKRQGETANTI